MKHYDIPSVTPIPFPFAYNGDTKVSPRYPELDPGKTGFTALWNIDSSEPGNYKAPSLYMTRQLINRLFNYISGNQFLQQIGQINTFDQKVCDAIGGYPQGAVLQWLNGDVLYDVKSMIDNNMFDFTKNGVDGHHWSLYGSDVFSYVYPDYGSRENVKTWENINTKNGLLSNDAYVATSTCWIQAYITNPEISSGLSNYQCGIVLTRVDDASPLSAPDALDTRFTTYEVTELGTVVAPILPCLAGTKVYAFTSQAAGSDTGRACDLVIRKLTPTRTVNR